MKRSANAMDDETDEEEPHDLHDGITDEEDSSSEEEYHIYS